MKETLKRLKPYLHGFPLVVLCVAITVYGTKKYLSYVTPMYSSTAKIKLADLKEGVHNNKLFKDFDVFTSSSKISSEIELMESSLILTEVIESLNFDNELYRVGKIKKAQFCEDAPFTVTPLWKDQIKNRSITIDINSRNQYSLYLEGSLHPIVARFGDTINLPDGLAILELNEELLNRRSDYQLIDRYLYKIKSMDNLLHEIRSNLTILASNKDVPVISISYKSAVPQLAARFANKLAEVYIKDYINYKYQTAETTVNFLDDRINEVSRDLSQSEKTIEQYKNSKGIVDLHKESETDLRKISQLKIQASNLKIGLDAITTLENELHANPDNFLNTAPNFQAYSDLLSTEMIKKIKVLQGEKRDLLLTYTPNDEKVKVIDEKLGDYTSYLLEAVTNTRKNTKIKYEQLLLEIDEALKVFKGFATKQKDIIEMNRDFNIFENSYNFLNEKRIEARIAQAAKISFHRVISPAMVSKSPTSPNTVIITIVSALLALIGSNLIIYLVHRVRGKVEDPSKIEERSSIPIGLKTPFFTNTGEKNRHFVKEAIQLELKGMIQGKGIIVLSSNTNGEGRQYHTKNLAAALAKQERRVLIIDTQDIIRHADGAHVINFNSPDYRNSTKTILANTLDQMGAGYDVILVDNEAMKHEQIGLLMMSLADTNLYVIDTKRTRASHVTELELLKDEFNLPNMHFVVNKDEYNPNVFVEIYNGIKRCLRTTRKTKK